MVVLNFRKTIASAAVVLALVLISLAASVVTYPRLTRLLATDRAPQKISWRLRAYARKALGGLTDLSWTELWVMVRHRGGFGLESFVTAGISLDGSVHNPMVSATDRQVAKRLFQQNCTVCHGTDGAGWHAPALNHLGLMHGDSDFAIYKVLRDGVENTAMAPGDFSDLDRWRLVGYIRSLQFPRVGSSPHATHADVHVTAEQLREPGPEQWPTYSRSLDGHRYTPLKELTPGNVSRLRTRWIQQFDISDAMIESTPLVVGGAMLVTLPPSTVVALDVKSGAVLWTYTRSIPRDLPLCCGRVNRGGALLDDRFFLGTLDGYLVALDATNGHVIWQTRVASVADGYTITGAPLVVNRSIVVGVAGGEFGIRGFLAAYDAATGRQQWLFSTIPGPGEVGHETWANDAWKSGGGPTWVTGAYDSALDLVYWGVGNPSPDFSGEVRGGDNLFTDSVVALHARTGKLAWYFQFTPHDEHDWDSAQTPVLADVLIRGTPHKAICWANRNGFYYVLDRASGQFLSGTPYVDVNWAKGLDINGRPILSPSQDVSYAGRDTKPGVGGGTNWQNAAFDPVRQLVFVPATEGAAGYTKISHPGRGAGGIYLGSSGAWIGSMPRPFVRALDAASGARQWEYASPPLRDGRQDYSGLLATAGGVVFGASGGAVFAVDAETGREAWRVSLGGQTSAPPISFSIDGRQVLAVSAGKAMFLFGL